MFSYSKFEHHYTKSAFPYEEPISKDFKVFVNGEEIPVYTCRISKRPFNRPWPGYQRQINQTELASFVNIVSDEEIKIDVIPTADYERVMIRPYSKGIKFTENDKKVSFTIKDEAQLVFACDDLHNPLYIFNSKPIKWENPEDVTYYFGPGVHMPGKITLKDNESLYVDKDALVFGCIYAENAENIKVYGNGLFDDSTEERFFIHCYEDFTNGNIKFYECKNVSVEGVLFRNSSIWCVNLFNCFDCVLDNIKVFGQWRYNTDGVDIVNSKNITLKNSFIQSFDDTVVIKGVDRYIDTDNENILTENCVLWCDWGKTCELGFETACARYKNIVFRNCDLVKNTTIALDIMNGDCAEISDVVFENINVEFNHDDKKYALQTSEDHVYDADDEKWVPMLVYMSNPSFRKAYANDVWKIPEKTGAIDLSGVQESCIHDITVKNINVYYDDRIPVEDGESMLYVGIISVIDDVKFYNITISDVKINGKPVEDGQINMDVRDIDNFVFE